MAQGYVQNPTQSHGVVSTQRFSPEDGTFIMCHHPAKATRDLLQGQGDAVAAAVAVHTETNAGAHGDARWLSDSHDVVSTQGFSSERWCFIMYHHTASGPQGLPLQEANAHAVCMQQWACRHGLVCTDAHRSAQQVMMWVSTGAFSSETWCMYHFISIAGVRNEEAAFNFACPMLDRKARARRSSGSRLAHKAHCRCPKTALRRRLTFAVC